MTEIRGFFPVNRKRKVLGTIPVTLNLKEGTMKVREDKMELKPIEEMTVRELKEELKQRSSDSRKEIYRMYVKYLRENDIGTENLTPSEPDWKRWRKWPEEKPIPLAHVEWELKSRPQCVETGIYIPFESAALPFRKGLGLGVGSGVCCWRYIEEPPEPLTWKNVERDGNPSEAGWYEIPPNGPYRRFRYWEGKFWNLHMGGEMCGDPTGYCPIAPAPKFDDANQA